MRPSSNTLNIGMFGGLLSGHCGYYVILYNKNSQVSNLITITRDKAEAELGGHTLQFYAGSLLSMIMAASFI